MTSKMEVAEHIEVYEAGQKVAEFGRLAWRRALREFYWLAI